MKCFKGNQYFKEKIKELILFFFQERVQHVILPYKIFLSYNFIEPNEANKPNIDWLVVLFGHRDLYFLRHIFSNIFMICHAMWVDIKRFKLPPCTTFSRNGRNGFVGEENQT